jgi:AraC-like DNA-binding protein
LQVHKSRLKQFLQKEPAVLVWLDHCKLANGKAGAIEIMPFDQQVLSASSSSNMAGTISMRLLNRVVNSAVSLGAERRTLLTDLGIREASLRHPLARVSIVTVMRLVTALELQFSDPAICIRLGYENADMSFSDPGFAFRFLPNLSETISAFVARQSARQNVATVMLSNDPMSPILTWQVEPNQAEILSRFIEFSVAHYLRLSHNVLAERAIIKELHFMHRPRFALSLYEELFGFVPQFGMPQPRLQLASRQLFRPALFSNPALAVAAIACEQRPQNLLEVGDEMRAMVYLYLANHLPGGNIALNDIAETFAVTPRTLRRKLTKEGQSFRALLDQVRQDYAHLYQKEGMRPISEIARLLGYAEISAFSRSHKRWTGQPPSRHR